jgi:biotin carboxylase
MSIDNMKKIILLQNHPVFTLDIAKISNPDRYELYLITTQTCVEQLRSRNQQDMFNGIHVLDKFDLASLVDVVNLIKIDGSTDINIVTSSEQAMDICGKLRVYFNLDNDDLERYANKLTMKQSLIASDIRYPKYLRFDDESYKNNADDYLKYLCETIPFPMFAKPINEAGSIGTALIKNRDELNDWCLNKNPEKLFEIDEYIEGVLYHCDAFIKDKEIIYSQVSMYLNPCFDFTCGKTMGSIVLLEDSEDSIRIQEFNKKTLMAMGIPKNGMTHLEVFKKHDGELVFVEVAARPPASLAPKSYYKYLGVPIMEAHLLMQIDENYDLKMNFGPYSAFVIYPKMKGVVSKFNEPNIKSKYEISYNMSVGDELTAAEKVRDIAAGIILWNDNHEELMKDYLSFDNFKLYEVN